MITTPSNKLLRQYSYKGGSMLSFPWRVRVTVPKIIAAALGVGLVITGFAISSKAHATGPSATTAQVATARALVAKSRLPVKFKAPGPAFSTKKAKGKLVYDIARPATCPTCGNQVYVYVCTKCRKVVTHPVRRG